MPCYLEGGGIPEVLDCGHDEFPSCNSTSQPMLGVEGNCWNIWRFYIPQIYLQVVRGSPSLDLQPVSCRWFAELEGGGAHHLKSTHDAVLREERCQTGRTWKNEPWTGNVVGTYSCRRDECEEPVYTDTPALTARIFSRTLLKLSEAAGTEH